MDELITIQKMGTMADPITDKGELSIKFVTMDEVDRDGDMFKAGSLHYKNTVPMAQFNHGEGLPVGTGSISMVGKDAVWSGQLDMESDEGAATFRYLKKMGSDAEFSFRSMIPRSQTKRNNSGGRDIMKAEVVEVCSVFKGGGRDTGILSMKSVDEQHDSDASVRAQIYSILLDSNL